MTMLANDNGCILTVADRCRLEGLADERTLKTGPQRCEIVPGVTPAWYVLLLQPGMEALAILNLVSRGFGIYQPFVTIEHVIKGRKYRRRQPLFRGYLFTFVWGMDVHQRRILACPGIRGILMIDDRFATLSDQEIGAMQIMEMDKEGIISQSAAAIPAVQDGLLRNHRKKRRGYSKAAPTAVVVPEDAGTSVTISTKSYWHMDAEERIAVLESKLSPGS